MNAGLQANVDLREVFDEDERGILGRIVSNGGAMRQAQLAECVDYSKSKLSGHVTDLVDQGHIEKVRYGRENVLYLPGCEPALVAFRGSRPDNREQGGTDE